MWQSDYSPFPGSKAAFELTEDKVQQIWPEMTRVGWVEQSVTADGEHVVRSSRPELTPLMVTLGALKALNSRHDLDFVSVAVPVSASQTIFIAKEDVRAATEMVFQQDPEPDLMASIRDLFRGFCIMLDGFEMRAESALALHIGCIAVVALRQAERS